MVAEEWQSPKDGNEPREIIAELDSNLLFLLSKENHEIKEGTNWGRYLL